MGTLVKMFKSGLIALLLVAAVSALPAKKQLAYKSPMPRMPRRGGLPVPSRPDGRIVGGSLASQGQFPYQAAVYIDDRYFCGGTLLASDWVLCAAHCTTGSASIRVTMGDLDRSDNSGFEQESTSANIITHEDYIAAVTRNDISVIQVSPAFELNSNVQTLPIADSSSVAAV